MIWLVAQLAKLLQFSPPPAEFGKDQRPGEAAEGTVLHIIEVAVKERVRLNPDIPLRDLYDLVKEFDVVRNEGRDVCKLFLDECKQHYRLPQVGSHGGQSIGSTAPSDGGSQAPSRNDFRSTPATSATGGQPSTLALNDSTSTIEIILPNDVAKPVVSTTRNGYRSYISQSIVDRFNLTVDRQHKVLIELRWRIEDGGRGRSYRVRNCSFKIQVDLGTDLAIGRKVQEQLKTQAGPTEDSYDTHSSSEVEASRNGRPQPESQSAEISSRIGSTVSSSGGKATTKDYLDTVNRIMALDDGSRA